MDAFSLDCVRLLASSLARATNLRKGDLVAHLLTEGREFESGIHDFIDLVLAVESK
jgi:hypothetical protein